HDLDGCARGVHDERLGTHAADGVDQKRNRGYMVQMRVRDKDRVDLRQLRERQIADAGAGVEQHIVVDQERSRPQVSPADAARAAEYAQTHGGDYFSSNTVTGSQSAVIGVARALVTRSACMG